MPPTQTVERSNTRFNDANVGLMSEVLGPRSLRLARESDARACHRHCYQPICEMRTSQIYREQVRIGHDGTDQPRVHRLRFRLGRKKHVARECAGHPAGPLVRRSYVDRSLGSAEELEATAEGKRQADFDIDQSTSLPGTRSCPAR